MVAAMAAMALLAALAVRKAEGVGCCACAAWCCIVKPRCVSGAAGVVAQHDFEQVGNGVGAEFFHDVGAVGFNGFDADV